MTFVSPFYLTFAVESPSPRLDQRLLSAGTLRFDGKARTKYRTKLESGFPLLDVKILHIFSFREIV